MSFQKMVQAINKIRNLKRFKMKNSQCEIQELKNGDWFMLNNGEEIRNKYQFLGEVMPKVYSGVCPDDNREFDFGTIVEKIEGFGLYLMQGGRDWD